MSGEANQKLFEKIENATVILIDIAGTSSSISFVKDTLFPYALKKAESFFNDKWEDESIKEIVKSLQEADSEVAKKGEKEEIVKSLVTAVKRLTEKDSDVAAFKKLQGLIYAEGYKAGDLKGHVYADFVSQLKVWSNGKRVCVYSTGNIESQKLLFSHSIEGDLSGHITEYFDSSIGSKTNAESYTKIASKLDCKPEEVIFLTDSVEEAKAALEAKMTSVLVHREGNAEIPESSKKEFSVITSFTDLSTETSAKRKIEESEQEVPPAKVAKTESETKKNTEDKPTKEDEKMEVDTEATSEAKEEKKEGATNVTANNDETKKTETEAEKINIISKSKEEKPSEQDTDKKVPSKEETKSDDDKLKTDAMETDSTEKTEETGKQTENKETEKSQDLNKEKDSEITDKVDISKDTNTSNIETKENDKLEDKPTENIVKETINDEKKAIENTKDEKIENKVDEKTEKSENETSKTETDSKVSENVKVDEPAESTTTDSKTNDVDETKQKTENAETNDETPTETKKEEIADKEESNGKIDEKTDEQTSTSEQIEKSVKETEEVNKNGNSNDTDVEKSTEEKENDSDLANGAHENGDSKKVVEEETDIKVKKIEAENTENTEAVSVEVTA